MKTREALERVKEVLDIDRIAIIASMLSRDEDTIDWNVKDGKQMGISSAIKQIDSELSRMEEKTIPHCCCALCHEGIAEIGKFSVCDSCHKHFVSDPAKDNVCEYKSYLSVNDGWLFKTKHGSLEDFGLPKDGICLECNKPIKVTEDES